MATTAPPPKADNATTPSVYDGLCEALNAFQNSLVAEGKFEVADSFSIEFSPPELGQALLQAQGGAVVNQTNVGMAPQNLQTRPDAQAVDTKSVTQSTHSGMQITQFIDQIMRNSKYITDQTTYRVDQTSGDTKKGSSSTSKTKWYKINFNSAPIKYDDKRKDFAYKISYIVTQFLPVDLQSPYFQAARFRGVHKSYDYWFTGLNNSIINFEQDLNKQWTIVASGYKVPAALEQSDSYEVQQRVYQPFSDASSQGREGSTNEPQANAANYLFNPSDMSKVSITITGDPAWLQQGEAAGGTNGTDYSTNAFNSDGSINFDASEIVFRINWNTPQDYDMNKGIIEPGRQGATIPRQNLAAWENNKLADVSVLYIAISCRSTFSKGAFTQTIEGRLFFEPKKSTAQANATPNTAQANVIPNTTQQTSLSSQTLLPPMPSSIENGVDPTTGRNIGIIQRDEAGTVSKLRINPEDGSLYDPTGQNLIVRDP